MKTNLFTTTTLFLFLTAGTVYTQTNVFPSSGNVGIGTTTPGYKLHTIGTISSTNLGRAGYHLYNNGATSEFFIGQESGSSHNFKIQKLASGIYTNFVDIDPNGNVGIGITAPTAKLDVNGSIQSSNEIISTLGSGIGQFRAVASGNSFLIRNDGTDTYFLLSPSTGSFNSLRPFSIRNGNGDVYFANSTIFIKHSNGTLGIGLPDQSKTSLGYKLFVNGGIITDKIKVATYANWADYVFAANYKLKPLNEVESFIEQNKHLPNVPSAKDVKEQGIDLAEMQAKQMEKIEELTLYIIQLNKKIEVLEKQSEAIKK